MKTHDDLFSLSFQLRVSYIADHYEIDANWDTSLQVKWHDGVGIGLLEKKGGMGWDGGVEGIDWTDLDWL